MDRLAFSGPDLTMGSPIAALCSLLNQCQEQGDPTNRLAQVVSLTLCC